MHIYYLIHYFPPELNGGATRAAEMARLWTKADHKVTVLTGFPNHPHGLIPAEYKGQLFKEETKDGYQVRRNWVYATPNKGSVKRILNHSSLTLSTVLGSLLKQDKPDVIIASSPPLFLGISGYLLSRVKRTPFVFEVRDIWPQQAVDLGMLTNPSIIKAMERLEMSYYHKAAKIIGVTQSTQRILSERGIDREKIEVIYNGTSVAKFRPEAVDVKLKEKYGLKDKFVVSYIGTMGLSQGLTTILQAAEQLQNTLPHIHFLLVGDGAEREKLIALAKQKSLANVTFLSSQPREKIAPLYHLSDLSLVLLKDLPLFRSTIPSKIYEIMACARPIVLGVRGEVKEIVERAQAGLCIEPENSQQLIEAVGQLAKNPNKAKLLGLNGRKYAIENHDIERLAQKYLDILQTIT